MRKQELHPRTVIINKKQKIHAKKTRNEALLWLARMFPRAFDNSVSIHPLKLGIMADILAYEKQAAEAGISKSKLREAVVVYARRLDYLACLKAREMRIDLDGNPVTRVTEEEAHCAAEKIKKRIEKSIKNARKIQPLPEIKADAKTPQVRISMEDDWDNATLIDMPSRTPSITIKRKQSRAYDPELVARLKAKLGLPPSHIDKEAVE